ncbi:MAG: hypothetical protein QOE00_3091 [Ilumatobacteraceae bacterium]
MHRSSASCSGGLRRLRPRTDGPQWCHFAVKEQVTTADRPQVTEELASQPGTLATRPDEQEETAPGVDADVAPLEFRLNLKARLAEPSEPLTTREHPLIRKLKWEHVVSDLPPEPSPIGATPVPLPPPPAPPPPTPSATFQPPISSPVAVTAAETPAPAPVAPPAPGIDTTPSEVAPPVVEPEVIVAPVVVDEPAADHADALVDDWLDEEIPDEDMPADIPDEAVPGPTPPIPAAPPYGEINRLSSVPDLILDDSPVDLPPITTSGGPIPVQHNPALFVPVLPETMFVAAARPITANVAALIAESAPSSSYSRRKPKRHPFRKLFTFLVLLGMLGGGAYFARKYLVKKDSGPAFSAELDPLATDVATARGLQFKTAVEVQALAPDVYAARLAGSVLPDQPGRAEAWRALGLLNGELDAAAIGGQAMNDSPAFYDPVTKTIVVSNDLEAYEHLYRFAMHRALTAALLDQQFDWSTRVTTATPAVALGLRATIDGDALAVANSLAAADAPDQLAPEMFSFVQGHASATSPSQYAAAITGRAGVAMRPTIVAMSRALDALSVLEQVTPASDAMLDAARPATAAAGVPADSQGMMFWYYVLASRIDDTQAWSAVTHWSSDSVSRSVDGGGECVDATVAAGDADGAAAMLTAFQSWAAGSTPESATTVAAADANQVAIHACDPGAAITATLPTKVPVVFGGAGVERALVQAAFSAAAGTKVDAGCLITAARQRGTLLTSPADDAPVLAVNWQPAYVTASLDLAAGCVSAG